MEVKKDILWRVYLSFLGIVVFGFLILGRAFYIQQVEGDQWRKLALKQQQKVQEIAAERGSIFSEDGSMLSTSIPFFDIYIDFGAEGLREKNGRLFKKHLDSLSLCLAKLFGQKPAAAYQKLLTDGYRRSDRYFLLRKNISFQQYQELRHFPLVREGKNKSGFIAEVRSKRQNPFGLMANRTIGLYREFRGTNGKLQNTNVGLEYTYDSLLRGDRGQRIVKYLAGGVYVPVKDSEVEPENGKDIITTLDVNIQDIAENALHRMMTENECEYGTCVVMEVNTGKIKAIANLGRRTDGTYFEDLNYAIRTSEPGSTFKLATLLALLEDNKVNLNSRVNLEGGKWMINGRTVWDSEQHGLREVTVKEAFAHSSNVGMAKLTMSNYAQSPIKYIDHLRRLRLHETSGIDLAGEGAPVIKNPKSKTWSATSLPWMSFGYEVQVSPLQTLMMYNAIANQGQLMKPYLVNAVLQNGLEVKTFAPQVLTDRVARPETIRSLQECLIGVCHEQGGTAFNLFKGSSYQVAGKTGTALMANGSRGYADHIYQSSFVGYFPADHPLYSCIVVIRNKPYAKKFYGAAVAGPVFKEIADKLYAGHNRSSTMGFAQANVADSLPLLFKGSLTDFREILDAMEWKFMDSSAKQSWGSLMALNGQKVIRGTAMSAQTMPDVRGMGLKDALFLLESQHLNVHTVGSGKVREQSIAPGTPLGRDQKVLVVLN